MSEYQYYEFVAIDRPLTTGQMAELRAISTRAEISPTRFWNEYNWGNLKADPARLVERYFDAHLYFANWGTRRLMLRVLKARVDVPGLKPYFAGKHAVSLKLAGKHVLLDFTSQEEEPDYEESPGSLAVLTVLRAELMCGDLRPAYLAWLLAVQADDVEKDGTEPPVPAGLATLTAAQEAMVEFLRIDADLLAAAASGSVAPAGEDKRFRAWVTRLPQEEKERWLLRAVEDPALALGGELLRAFCVTESAGSPQKRRTVAELQGLAHTFEAKRQKAEAARKKKAREAAARKRQQHLDDLGRDVDAAWARLETLIEAKSYDDATKLAADLRDLAASGDDTAAFASRFEAMRKRKSSRRGFFDRWKRANEPSGAYPRPGSTLHAKRGVG